MYFEEAQEKLKNKLLLLKNRPPFVLVRAVDPHIPALPLLLVHKQLLYTAHSHQRLWEYEQYTHTTCSCRDMNTNTHGLLENRIFTTGSLTPTGDVTPEGFIYSLCWPNLSWDQVTIPTPHCGFIESVTALNLTCLTGEAIKIQHRVDKTQL